MKKQLEIFGILVVLNCIWLGGCSEQNNNISNISPARNVPGNWSGIPVFTDRVDTCYEKRWN